MLKKKRDVVIVGAGICGIAAARFLAEEGATVLLLEQKPVVGGLCAEGYYKNTRYSKFGAHIFHTDDAGVFNFVNRFCEWVPYTHFVKSFDCGKFWTVPINKEELHSPKELWSTILEKRLYHDYTKKMWGDYYELIYDRSIVRIAKDTTPWDDRYFHDQFQGYPREGYTALFNEMLDHWRISVLTNINFAASGYSDEKKTPIIYTGRLDMFPLNDVLHLNLPFKDMWFGYDKGGSFPWSADVGVINFPNDFPFIRAHSSKTLYQQRVKDDVVVYDYPTRFDRAVVGKSAYPIIFDASEDVQKALVGLISEQRPNVYPAGRAGTFSYLDMDKAIKSGWAAANRLLAEGE